MKHIKRFNEDKTKDIKEFCELYLANLIDNSELKNVYSFDCRTNPSKMTQIQIKSNGKQALKWDDFKIEFLPFYEMLTKEFKIIPMGDLVVTINGSHYTKEKIFSDDFSLVKPGEWGNYVEKVSLVVNSK